ncbi:TetR/AcrR family transcriptional regulator [Paenibacillus rigui]|uniref:TetR family transcriptional regulator n=1 Tax=Paenibacillus rigui TaxID=554312 RepID=A0A229UH23_9BACL|nr:TetR/AcrR family transcriptional regulator [Paenibacillus rigui]OXM82650.1 TetR family transcriptional regulator [Paenibacillus rigui]
MGPGRPRAFSVEKALESAMEVFWQKGYEGASLTDLTEAMNINRSSFYSTFVNKEQLFNKVLELYLEKGPPHALVAALDERTANEVIQKFLQASAEAATRPGYPPGCLTVMGAITCSDESSAVKHTLTEWRIQIEHALKLRLESAKKKGDLSAHQDPTALARYIATISSGMSIQAVNGASRKELEEVIEITMSALL